MEPHEETEPGRRDPAWAWYLAAAAIAAGLLVAHLTGLLDLLGP